MTALRLLLGITKLDKLRNENTREQLLMNETILQVVQNRQKPVTRSCIKNERYENSKEHISWQNAKNEESWEAWNILADICVGKNRYEIG